MATVIKQRHGPSVTLQPPRFVRVPVFAALTGYSERSIEGKIRELVWVEGREFKRAPDGHLLIDIKGFERWVENH